MDNVSKVISKIKKKDWAFDVYRKFVWFIEDTQVLFATDKVIPHYEKYFNFQYQIENALFINGHEFYDTDETGTENLYNFYAKSFKRNSNFFIKFSEAESKIVKDASDYTDYLKKLDFTTVSKIEITNEFNTFCSKFIDSFLPAWLRPDELLEKMLHNLLVKELCLKQDVVAKYKKDILTSHSLEKLKYTSERIDLLKLALFVKESKISIDRPSLEFNRRMGLFLDRYGWMKDPEGICFTSFSRENFINQLKVILNKDMKVEIKRIIVSRNRTERNVAKFIEKFNLNNRQKNLVKAVRDFVFLRTYTTEACQELFWTGRKTLFPIISKYLNVSADELAMLSSREILLFLHNPSRIRLKSIIQERVKGFAVVIIGGKVTELFGENALELINGLEGVIFIDREKKSSLVKARQISGTVASSGKVRGIAKVITSHQDISGLELGEVLVTSMTTPEYVVAMERAIAFVTDEGGITCHAAIVAREWGVPCIVGTSNATQIIKSGDYVEVDANNGVVKILSSAHERK